MQLGFLLEAEVVEDLQQLLVSQQQVLEALVELERQIQLLELLCIMQQEAEAEFVAGTQLG